MPTRNEVDDFIGELDASVERGTMLCEKPGCSAKAWLPYAERAGPYLCKACMDKSTHIAIGQNVVAEGTDNIMIGKGESEETPEGFLSNLATVVRTRLDKKKKNESTPIGYAGFPAAYPYAYSVPLPDAPPEPAPKPKIEEGPSEVLARIDAENAKIKKRLGIKSS